MSTPSTGDVEIRLVVTNAAGETRLATVGDGPLMVGRGASCGVVVSENRVSRNHCVIFPLAGSLQVKDLGSSNGTLVNGESVSVRKLVHGDVIEVGGTRIRVQLVDQVRSGSAPADDDECEEVPRLSLVESLSALLQGSRDLSATAKAAVGFLQELIPAERSFVLLASERTPGKLPVLATARAPGAPADGPPPSANLAYEILKTGQAYYTANGSSHPRFGTEIQNRAVLCAPLELDGERLGVLYSDSAAGTLLPDEELAAIFDGIASQTARSLAEAAGHVQEAAEAAVPHAAVQAALMRTTGFDVPAVSELHEASDYRDPATKLEEQREAARQVTAGLVRDARRLTESLNGLIDRVSQSDPGEMATAMAHRAAQRYTARMTELAEACRLALTTEAVAIELDSENVDMGELLAAVVRGVRDEAGLERVTLGSTGVARSATAFVDRNAMLGVLDTLASLAVYLAAPGGSVRLECRQEAETVNVSIDEAGGDQRTDERYRLIFAWSNKVVPEPQDLGALLTAARLTVEAHGGRLNLSGDRTRTGWVVSLPSSGDATMEVTEVSSMPPEILALVKKSRG